MSTLSRLCRYINGCKVSAMVALLVFASVLALLGVASALGWTCDSRDSEYSLGPVLAPRTEAREPAGSAVPLGQVDLRPSRELVEHR
ncbi:MAG: hypothetical protein JWO57_3769 [Pseudonocardiales bacterium]|nr:hypothetical protein [Pseudonocardiales bacterium]